MATPAHTTQTWRFGIFEVDAHKEELCRAGIPIRIREHSFRILVFLLQRAGEIVTREQLREILWPADTFVDFEHGLNTAVMKLREALDDSAETPLYIETIPRRGYRFIAPVTTAPDVSNGQVISHSEPEVFVINGASAATQLAPAPAKAEVRLAWLKPTAAVFAISLLAAAIWYLRRPLPSPHITGYTQLTNDGRIKTIAGTDGSKLFVNVAEPEALEQISLPDGRSASISD